MQLLWFIRVMDAILFSMKFIHRFNPKLPILIATAILMGTFFICSGHYAVKQGVVMLGHMNRAVPLEDLTKPGKSSEENTLFVQRAEDIRRFAINELGLKDSKNYTHYVELDRGYIAAVVSASAADSFTRYEWWFPVIGRVPYKGFFNDADAEKERVKLKKKDLDVWVRGVDAFSTLGWFRDPLYSYMKKYSDIELADLIIHELVHATVYLNNHSQFNEELAQFVGTEGARLYVKSIRNSNVDEHITTVMPFLKDVSTKSSADALYDRAIFHTFIRGLIAELDDLYNSGVSREEKLLRKKEIIDDALAEFDKSYADLFKTENHRGFSKLSVNNAYLDLFRLYHEEDEYFKDIYEKSRKDLPKFIAAAKTLNSSRALRRGKGNPKEALEHALGLK